MLINQQVLIDIRENCVLLLFQYALCANNFSNQILPI